MGEHPSDPPLEKTASRSILVVGENTPCHRPVELLVQKTTVFVSKTSKKSEDVPRNPSFSKKSELSKTSMDPRNPMVQDIPRNPRIWSKKSGNGPTSGSQWSTWSLATGRLRRPSGPPIGGPLPDTPSDIGTHVVGPLGMSWRNLGFPGHLGFLGRLGHKNCGFF